MKIWIYRKGKDVETFTLEEVRRALNQGQFGLTDLGWQEGMESWKRLADFEGLKIPPNQGKTALLASTFPPLPASPPIVSDETFAIVNDAEDGPAWERRKILGWVRALTQTWKEVLFHPTVSFSWMKTGGGFRAPFLFNLIMVVIGMLFSTSFSLLAQPSALNVVMPIVALLLLVGSSFLSAGITHLCLALFRGTSKSYEATYRVICYSCSTFIFNLAGGGGAIVASVWSVVCIIIGLSMVHRTESWRAATAVLIPIFVCLAIFVCVGLIVLLGNRR